MEKGMDRQINALVEDSIAKGFKIKQLSNVAKRALEETREVDPNLPELDWVRFTKLTARKRALIADVTTKQYSRDMQDNDILSYEKMKKIAIGRGEWEEDYDAKIDALQSETQAGMLELTFEGFSKRLEWTEEYEEDCKFYITQVEETSWPEEQKTKVTDIFLRWSNYTPDGKLVYNEKYAAEQGLAEYSVDRDYLFLMENAPSEEAAERLNTADDTRRKLQRLIEVLKTRGELNDLLLRRARIFAGTAEARRDNTEEMARLYFGIERVTEAGKPLGQLTAQFDQMFDLPDEVIEWLLVEAAFFYQGIPDSMREFYEEWGFIRADQPENTSLPSSEESLDPQTSKPDSLPSTTTDASSSDMMEDMSLTTTS